jgi:hypothetical protein
MKCIACGSEALVGGTVKDGSGRGTAVFQLDETAAWKTIFGVGVRPIQAHGCAHCGNLQLAVDFSEKDRLRFQQFEGEQPGLLERIASEMDTSAK